ncbi:MAG: carbon-nitrogen hydrolase family protein [Sporomusaceae bacterium]|nr:carbon-nitrogen hydrolase family protein [Sporomusaceae bacterium]
MKVAMLHLALSAGPAAVNLRRLQTGIEQAAAAGADWVITPETALQGYFFAGHNPATELTAAVSLLTAQAARHRITLFLGLAERDTASGKQYNSCLVVSPQGILGRHRKLRRVGTAEAWAAKGRRCRPIATALLKAGILICADLWYPEHAAALARQGAEVIVAPAAWPPGTCGPADCWERASAAAALPVWVCNQTGCHQQLDFRRAESVVAAAGKTLLRYSGEAAVLLFDWDTAGGRLLSRQFGIRPAGGEET